MLQLAYALKYNEQTQTGFKNKFLCYNHKLQISV